VYRGSHALEFTLPTQNVEWSNAIAKLLTTKRDVLYLRYAAKYESNNVIVGSSHNGSSISASYYINGQATPGVPADGTNKFLANFEAYRDNSGVAAPGQLNVYIYHPEQRSQWGDLWFPTGIILPYSSTPSNFGPTFVSRPDVIPELGRWYSYEIMVKANTPGLRDGRITLWVDGQLIADFPNVRLRDVDTLKIDRFDLCFHARENAGSATHKWYDNVVAATSYIGPVQ
jgi:hypothetical protein